MVRGITVLMFVLLAAGAASACAVTQEDFERAFTKADTNADRTLSAQEYFGAFKDPVAEEEQPVIFRRLDKNSDGVLKKNEFNTQAGSANPTDGMTKGVPKSATQETQGCGLSRLK